MQQLEQQNAELQRRLGAVAEEIEGFRLRDIVPGVGESRFGLGPAASKVYAKEQGLSIGGYGEVLFTQNSGATDVLDAQRLITYFGYKFSDRWVFNSEIEFEHGSTGGGGTVAIEFAYVDYLWREELAFRAGFLLMPMGLVNELHEPISFLPASRPQTETRIIPSTWREIGAGIFGEAGGFAYKLFGVGGLDGEDFSDAGIRGGRQSGARAQADDFAAVARLDWVGTDGLLLGASAYHGDAGQDHLDGAVRITDMSTTVVDVHAEYRTGPWVLRGLYATAVVEDAGTFNTRTGANLARRMQGWYVEGGVDVLALAGRETRQALTPFVRYEQVDTQAWMPGGFAPVRARDNEILTVGLNWKPIEQIVFKFDYERWIRGDDRANVLMGFVF
ncbi:MAG TPA: hypothetical protein VK081_02920 [Planctomycetota bacterium]|nr:hypothetical protein [Planctomycetota bacterium]